MSDLILIFFIPANSILFELLQYPFSSLISSQVANEREALKRRGLKPKDHQRANILYLKDLERKKTERLDSVTAHEPFKLSRFKKVESKVRQTLEEWQLGQDSFEKNMNMRPHSSSSFTKKGEGVARLEQKCKDLRKERPATAKSCTKPPVPNWHDASEESAKQRSSDHIDYIKRNALSAIRGSSQNEKHDQSFYSSGYKYDK